jgi:MFS family permease
MQGGRITTKAKVSGEGKASSKMDKKPELVPPDGGWGWIVVVAYALSNMITLPILQSFGLLYKGRFDDLEITGTDVSVIINVNSAFGMILGLFNGALLRSFGYRKITIVGALINTSGVILTSYAKSFVFFLVAYGIISSVGFNLLMSALNLAINTYFRERRSKATGFAMTAMGLGPVFMPLVISKLMDIYGVTGTALILGGLSLHSLVAALLLQPVKWHMKKKEVLLEATETVDEVGGEPDDEREKRKSLCWDESVRRRRTLTSGSSVEQDIDIHSVYGIETPLMEHRNIAAANAKRRYSTSSFKRGTSQMEDTANRRRASEIDMWRSEASLNAAKLGSTVKTDDKTYLPLGKVDEDEDWRKNNSKKEEITASDLPLSNVKSNGVRILNNNANLQEGTDSSSKEEDKKLDGKKEKLTSRQRLGRGIVAFFDLGLFTDPVYVNLMLGMSLAICAELNFSLLTPFILADRGYDTDHIAIIMSVIAGLDIVFRFLAPFFSDYYKIEARDMYIIALIMLLSSRMSLAFSYSFNAVLVVAVALGVSKGVRTVYMSLVIPSYVPIERLAAAAGIQMVVNGILLMAFGPLIGYIRDVSGGYDWCIGFINLLTIITLVMWTTEIIITRCRNRNEPTSN